MDTKNKKNPKNEVDELNQLFENFKNMKQTQLENSDINYEEEYTKNEILKHFNRRIIECNRLCIKYPEIENMLFEEQNCLNNCQRKIVEVEGVVKKYMNQLKANSANSPYFNPNI
jgi:hypothetical protein